MNQKSFSPVDNNIHRETEEILQKMETITKAKKNKKNNYKNVDVLENVYEEPEKPESKTFVGRFTDFAKGLTEMQQNMEKINKELEALDVEGFEGFAEDEDEGFEGEEEGFDDEEEGFEDEEGFEGEEGFEDEEEGFEDEEEGFEDEEEGFEGEEGFKSYGPKKLYRREYEPTNGGLAAVDKTLYARLMQFARRGKLSKSFLRRLRRQGLISRRQYNRLMRRNRRAQRKKKSNSKKSKSRGKCKSNRFKEFLDKLVKFIRKYTDKYNKLMIEMATYIYEFAGGNKKSYNARIDIPMIAMQIRYFFMVPFAIYFAYNWYYILLYRDESNQRIPNTFGETVNDYASYGLLRYLFTSLVQPMIVLNAYFRRLWPWIIESCVNLLSYLRLGKLDFTFLYTFFSNPIVQFMGLALTILYYACKYGDLMYNTFFKLLGTTGSIKIKMPKDKIFRFILLILVFDVIVGVVRHRSTIVNLFNRATSIYQMMTAPIITIALWIFLVIFTFVNMHFALLFCILYLYIYSYAALAICGKKGAGSAWNDINQLLRSSVSKIGGRDCPPNPTWIQKVFVILMSQLFNLLIVLMFILVLCYGIYTYIYFMKAESPKGMLIAFHLFIVLSLVGIVINSVRSGILNFDKGKQYDNIG